MPKQSKKEKKAAVEAKADAAAQGKKAAELKAKQYTEADQKRREDAKVAALAEAADAASLAEEEAKLSQDRKEKEDVAMKIQAIHRGRAHRKAAKEAADLRHDDCEVRKAVHAKSTTMTADNPLFQFETEEITYDKDLGSADDNIVCGRSLYCLPEDSGVRHEFNNWLNHPTASTFLLGCILVNVFILSIETPTSTFEPETKELLHLADMLLSIIFSSKRPPAPMILRSRVDGH